MKATLKEIKNLINNQTSMIKDPKDGEPVTPCMYVYKAKIQSDGSLDKIKLRIVVRGDLQNKEMIGDTWSSTASMKNLKYFLADSEKHKERVHQLDFIGAFLQANVKNRVFVKLDMRYAAYFTEYSQYFGRALKLSHTRYIARIMHFVRNGEKCKMHKTEWCEGGLQLVDIGTKSVSEPDLPPRMKYIMIRL